MPGIVAAFDGVDADLRSVIRLSPGAWDTRFVRDDLEGRLSDGELERLFQNVLANQVSASELGTIGDHGEFFGQFYRFEKCVIFQFPAGRHTGWVVSHDDTDDFPVDAVFEAATRLPPIDD